MAYGVDIAPGKRFRNHRVDGSDEGPRHEAIMVVAELEHRGKSSDETRLNLDAPFHGFGPSREYLYQAEPGHGGVGDDSVQVSADAPLERGYWLFPKVSATISLTCCGTW